MAEKLAANPDLLLPLAIFFGLLVVAGWLTQLEGGKTTLQRRRRAGATEERACIGLLRRFSENPADTQGTTT